MASNSVAPETVKVLQCPGPFHSEKTGTDFYMVQAETPNPIPGGFSTIRWSALSSKLIPPGTELPLASRLRDIKFDRGEGSFRV